MLTTLFGPFGLSISISNEGLTFAGNQRINALATFGWLTDEDTRFHASARYRICLSHFGRWQSKTLKALTCWRCLLALLLSSGNGRIAYIDHDMPVLSLDGQIGSWCCWYEGFHRYFMDLDEVTPWRL